MVTDTPDIEPEEQDDQKRSDQEQTVSELIHQLFSKGSPGDFDISMSTACLHQQLQAIFPGIYGPDLVGKILYEENFQLKVFPDFGPEWLLISK